MEVVPKKLPLLRKNAIWHPESGLIFSPYARVLPSKVTWDPASKLLKNLLSPRMLDDQHVYLAFYPRKNWDTGALFSTLAPPNISNLIVEGPRSTPDAPQFILQDDVCQAWAELENFLLDISDHLFSEFGSRQFLPYIDYPAWPHQCGYREAHASRVEVFVSLKRAQHAFRLLSAFVSFTLSLWITEFEDDCFDRPFQSLMKERAIPPIYLDYLRDSAVCRISDGFRPGGFLNPYTTKWGQVIFRFCRFCVPVWMIWGHEHLYKTVSPADSSIRSQFLPVDDYIKKIKMRQATFSWLILPDSKCFGGTNSLTNPPRVASETCYDHPLPDYAVFDNETGLADNTGPLPIQTMDRCLVVDTYRSSQLPKETWGGFRARMEASLEKRKGLESERERQSRESLETNARQNGHSKKSTVFYWEEDEVEGGFYRRTKIDRADVSKYWSECTVHQRFFWGHRNEWDLVPHLPRQPPGHRAETPLEELDIDDDRYNFLYSSVPPSKPDDSFRPLRLSLSRIRIHDVGGGVQSTGQYQFTFLPVTVYLKFRHGFSTSIIDNWHPELHSKHGHKKRLEATKWTSALRRLGNLRGQVPNIEGELKSIVNFHNICLAVDAKSFRLADLPTTWDHCSSAWLEQGLERLRVDTVTLVGEGQGNLYVIRPAPNSRDSSSWYVATSSSTAVLFVFRKRLLTMHEISTSFLDFGIPFHTVVERMKEDAPILPYRYRPRGLDARPMGFRPSEADYLAYVQSRDDLFRSPRARVLRLRGGIIGRLALEAVPNVAVLEGPSFCDDVIGFTDDTVFVDDFISENDLDIASGVYRVHMSQSGSSTSDLSWWPKHGTWMRTGLFTDQWTPDAESFFASQVKAMEQKHWLLKNATTWKESLKYDRLQMEPLYRGSEALAADFIKRRFKVCSFIGLVGVYLMVLCFPAIMKLDEPIFFCLLRLLYRHLEKCVCLF